MKKRFLVWLLAVIMMIPALSLPAGAAATTRFSDIPDQNTTLNVESLRLMGVLDGYSDGTFRPSAQLTRAQFCKMATYAMNGQTELGLYQSTTIFPDVKPSHWAAGYINLAAKGKAVIAGYPDGRFYPDRTVTVGQAVTILLRLLGYKDEQIGGVWPDSYMAAGAIAGLTEGLDPNGNAPLTRAQAAKLFVNLLQAETQTGGTLYTLSEETELLSVDGGSGTMKTLDGKTYPMIHPVASTSLTGLRGRVVLSGDHALTFLPSSSGATGNAAAAVIVYEDRSVVGFEELAGNNTYQIYKNGVPATRNDLKKNDVAIYNAATNSILVCDTRISVYYESCEPTPSAPTSIKVLGGTEFHVLPTAQDSLAQFKPGKQMVLLLTADGQIAATVNGSAAVRSNAVGIVSETGTIQMLCGNRLIPLNAQAEEKYHGQIVRISATQKDVVTLSVLTGGASGDLDISARTLGSKQLAENVLIFDLGKQIILSQITSSAVKKDQITYARTNWAGDVDLLVLNRKTDATVIYGKAIVRTTTVGEGEDAETTTTVEVVYGDKTTGEFETAYSVKNGAYVAAKIKNGQLTGLSELTALKKVSSQSWIGTGTVLHGGKTYTVSSNVLCYNLDSKEWVSLDQALAYSNRANLYMKDGVVQIIEVAHQM